MRYYLHNKYRLKFRSYAFDNENYKFNSFKEYFKNKNLINDNFYFVGYEPKSSIKFTLNSFFSEIICYLIAGLVAIELSSFISLVFLSHNIMEYDIVNDIFQIIVIILILILIYPILCFINMKYINWKYKAKIYDISGFSLKWFLIFILLANINFYIGNRSEIIVKEYESKLASIYEKKYGTKFNKQEYDIIDEEIKTRLFDKLMLEDKDITLEEKMNYEAKIRANSRFNSLLE